MTSDHPRRVRVAGDLFHGRVPEGAIYVGRAAPGLAASPYANPHRIGDCSRCGVTHDRAGSIEAFRRDFERDPGMRAAARRDLAGHDLACWCRPPEPCHVDVLLRVVTRFDEDG